MKICFSLFLGWLVLFFNSCALMTSMGLNNKASWDKEAVSVPVEETVWKKTQSLNTEEAYLDYLNQFPYGKHKYDARLQLQLMEVETAWEKTKRVNSEEAYKLFMRDFSGSKYNAEAFSMITKIRQEATWNRTKTLNTADAYNEFITRFPLSEYAMEAKLTYNTLRSEAEWNRIKDFNNIAVFEQYLKSFPNSMFTDQAKAKVQALKISDVSKSMTFKSVPASKNPDNTNRYSQKSESSVNEPLEKKDAAAEAWADASAQNTAASYQSFLSAYPKHKFASLAKKELALLDEQAWMRTKTTNTKEAYENYQKVFPGGRYVKEAKKKSIDQEVATILAGDYQTLPAMKKSESFAGSKLNEITIKNITGFSLVIIYSGPVSEKVEVKDGGTVVVKLPNGEYQITATLSSDLIGSFVGKEALTGGKYETKFFLGY